MRNSVIVSAAASLGLIAAVTYVVTKPKAGAETAASGPMTPGQAVYKQWCLDCHGAMPEPSKAGPGMGFPPAGTLVLQKRYNGDVPAVLTDRVDLSDEYIRYVVRNGQGMMPPTRKSEVTDDELDAVIEYLTDKKAK